MEQRVNDVGGLPGGPIRQEDHPVTMFQKRVDALYVLLTNAPVSAFRVDAVRRTIESNTKEDYQQFGYYDKWIRAIRTQLIEQNILTEAEINERIEVIKARFAGQATQVG